MTIFNIKCKKCANLIDAGIYNFFNKKKLHCNQCGAEFIASLKKSFYIFLISELVIIFYFLNGVKINTSAVVITLVTYYTNAYIIGGVFIRLDQDFESNTTNK